MKSMRNRVVMCSLPLALALAVTGCRTTARQTTPPIEAAAEGEVRSADQLLLWQVDARGRDARSAPVATRVREGVQQGLLSQGMRLADDGGDLRVTILAEAEEFDRSGNFYVFEGKMTGEVRVWDPRALAQDLVGRLDAAARGDRQLGEAEALRDLADKLTVAATEQATAHAASVRVRVAAETIEATLPWLRRMSGGDPGLAEYATRFIHVVSNLRGVLDCRLAARDPDAGTVSFRIIYRRDAFPQGLPNALLTQPELQLKRVR